MPEPKDQCPSDTVAGFRTKPARDYLNYFGKDRWLHLWFAEKRTRLVSLIVPQLVRLGLVPDTISYVGIAMLAGVVLYFVRQPKVAVLFLLGHVICDGLDGAFARNTGKASQSGAFTDLVADQVGMVVVAMMAILHHMVPPLLGTVYISLYLIVVVFGVLINVMGLGTRITITSKYILYIIYLLWAFGAKNYFSQMMSFFSVVMVAEVVIGYIRLKRGIRKKFDAEVRYSEGDLYSGRLNYALNVAVPLGVLAAILLWANEIPIRAMLDTPKLHVTWQPGPQLVPQNEEVQILGIGYQGDRYLVLVRLESEKLELRSIPNSTGGAAQTFAVPEYVEPAFGSLPVDGGTLLIADSRTRLVMGIDLDASFALGRAVTVLTVPLGYVSVTAAATTKWKNGTVWLAANYLHTRKTYLIDPHRALKKGNIMNGVVASYTNCAFPAGMTVLNGTVIELNRSPLAAMLYAAPLDRLTAGKSLLDAGKTSFSPPEPDAIGPVRAGDDLVMLSLAGRIWRLPIKDIVSHGP